MKSEEGDVVLLALTMMATLAAAALDDEDGGAANDAAQVNDTHDAGDVADAGFEAVDQSATSASTPAEAAEDSADAGAVRRRMETLVLGARGVDVRRIAGSAQVLTQQDLERRALNDVHRVLQVVPGVYVRDEEGFGNRPNIGLRGVDADRSAKVTLMEDGVLIAPAPYAAPQAYFFPSMARMVGVEVFKGPASIRFGPNTVGGALNFRTRDVPVGTQADIDLSLGNYGSARGHAVASWGNERFGFLLQGIRWGSSGFKQLDTHGPTGFERDEIMFKARASTDPDAFVRHGGVFKFTWGDERSFESYLGLTTADFKTTPYRRYAASQNDFFSSYRTQFELTYQLSIGSDFTLSTTAYRHDFGREWNRLNAFAVGPDFTDLLVLDRPQDEVYRRILRGEQDSRSPADTLLMQDAQRFFVSQGIQSIGSWKRKWSWGGNELEFGIRYHHDERRLRDLETGWLMKGGTMVTNGEGSHPKTWLNDIARAGSLWVQDSFAVGRLLITPGIRAELIDVFQVNLTTASVLSSRNVVPLLGLGAVYSFLSGFSVLAGVHQGFSPVAPGQDPSVLPERAVNSEAGVRFQRGGTRAEVIGFWSEYANVTGECTNSSGCFGDVIYQQFNGGRARVLGVEVLGSRRQVLPSNWVAGLDVAYTGTSARFLTGFTSANPTWGTVSEGDFIPYIPEHQLSVRLRIEHEPFELGVGMVWVSDVREQAGQGTTPEAFRVPGHWIFDAWTNWKFGPVTIYGTVNNLADRPDLAARRPFGARPISPLMMQVGLRYAFR